MAAEASQAPPKWHGHGQWSRNQKEELMKHAREALADWGRTKLDRSGRDNSDFKFILSSFQGDQAIYIQRVVHEEPGAVQGNAHHVKIHTNPMPAVMEATDCSRRDHPRAAGFNPDGFPGASVIYPFGKEQWVPMLQSWILKAGLRITSIITVFLLNMELLHDNAGNVPVFFANAFVVVSVLSLLVEIVFAWMRTREATKRVTAQNGNQVFASELVLRFLGMPHSVLTATTFEALDRIGGVPIVCNISRTARKYEDCSGDYQVLPKLLAEDILMASFKLCLFCGYQRSTSLNVAVLTAALSSCLCFRTLRNYFRTLLDYDDELLEHIRNCGDPFGTQGRRNNLPFEHTRELLRIDPGGQKDAFERKRILVRKICGCRRVEREEERQPAPVGTTGEGALLQNP